MDETQKPFACKSESCGMSFTNEDHLNVHTKKHAMVLHLSLGSKAAAYVADQTPTPTRLIRNCDEVGLFEDLHLQHVNPFEETFRQAVEFKNGSSMTPTLDHAMIMDDVLPQDETTLHTPHVLPYYDLADCSFKEESMALGDGDTAHDYDNCAFEKGPKASDKKSISESKIDDDADIQSTFILKSESTMDNDVPTSEHEVTDDVEIGDVKMKDEVIIEPTRPRPPALILSTNPSILSTSFKQIVDETLSDEVTPYSTQPLIQNNVKTIIVKPLPKLTRILPVMLSPATSKIPNITLNEASKRILLPKSKSLGETPTSIHNKLTAAFLKSVSSYDASQLPENDGKSRTVGNEKKLSKKVAVNGTKDDNLMKVSRNRAAAKRYRNKLKLWHNETKQLNTKLQDENQKLRAEVRHLKSLLLAHRDCSVTKAMSSLKHIPIELPVIAKERNISNSSVINDVAMNPVFLVVNKPIEYSSTASIT